MKKNDIENGIKARIGSYSPAFTVVWPNVKPRPDPNPPYIEFLPATALRDTQTLKGGEISREEGSYLINVVTELGTGPKTGYDLADSLADLFPSGLKLTITGGVIQFPFEPSIRDGFKEEGDKWIVPVLVRYVATAQ